jgi:hypothetical protein
MLKVSPAFYESLQSSRLSRNPEMSRPSRWSDQSSQSTNRITTHLQVAGDEKEPKDDEANHRPNLLSDVCTRSTNDLPPVPTE